MIKYRIKIERIGEDGKTDAIQGETVERWMGLEERIVYFRDNLAEKYEGWPGETEELTKFLNLRGVPIDNLSELFKAMCFELSKNINNKNK